DDFRRHDAAYSRQRKIARADGALSARRERLGPDVIAMQLVFPDLHGVYQTLAPASEAALRAVVGLWMVPHGLRMAFGFFPGTGLNQRNIGQLAADLDKWGYHPG